MDLAKPCLDVGLYTDRYEELRAFYVDRLGLPYEELLKAGRGVHQHRVGLHGSVLKLNSSREPLADAPTAFTRLDNYTRYFAQVFGLTEATRAAMQRRLEEREGVLMQQFEPRAVAPRIRVPTLVVHDRGDRINGFADGQAFAHAIQGARLLATEGLGHRRILKEAEVIGKVVVFAT